MGYIQEALTQEVHVCPIINAPCEWFDLERKECTVCAYDFSYLMVMKFCPIGREVVIYKRSDNTQTDIFGG